MAGMFALGSDPGRSVTRSSVADGFDRSEFDRFGFDRSDGADLGPTVQAIAHVTSVVATVLSHAGGLVTMSIPIRSVHDDGRVVMLVDRDARWVGGEAHACLVFELEPTEWVTAEGSAEFVTEPQAVRLLWTAEAGARFDRPEDATLMIVHATHWRHLTSRRRPLAASTDLLLDVS